MAARCRTAWEYYFDVERQQRAAQAEGIADKDYPPFVEVISRYRAHLRNCPQCVEMLAELREISARETEP